MRPFEVDEYRDGDDDDGERNAIENDGFVGGLPENGTESIVFYGDDDDDDDDNEDDGEGGVHRGGGVSRKGGYVNVPTAPQESPTTKRAPRSRCGFVAAAAAAVVILVVLAAVASLKTTATTTNAGNSDVDDNINGDDDGGGADDFCSSYSNNEVVVITASTADHDVKKNFCGGGSYLKENTTYILRRDIRCGGGGGGGDYSGTSLSSNVCLDCRGHAIIGAGNKPSGGDYPSAGIFVPRGATGAAIHNCAVSNFSFGADIWGCGTRLSNVRATGNAVAGVANGGADTAVDCSAIDRNGEVGILSGDGAAATTGIANSVVESNAADGVQVNAGEMAVSCSRIRFNGNDGLNAMDKDQEEDEGGGGDLPPVRVDIRDSVVSDNNRGGSFGVNIRVAIRNEGGFAALTDVTVCDADTAVRFSYSNRDAVRFRNVTCDDDDLVPRGTTIACESPCPADGAASSTMPLPNSCPTCPNGIGPYEAN